MKADKKNLIDEYICSDCQNRIVCKTEVHVNISNVDFYTCSPLWFWCKTFTNLVEHLQV